MNIRFAKRALLAALVGGLTGLLPLPAAAQQAAPAPIRVIEKADGLPKGPGLFGKTINKVCNVQTISCGETVSGTLSTQDCVLNDGSYVDYYEFPGTTGQTITATMRSNSVNSYLALLDPQDVDVQENNNGAGGNDARISFQLDVNGNWAIAAGSFSPHETGPYTLTLTCSGTQANTPAAPTGLQATAVSSNEIDLSWQDNSNNETGFIIEAIINGSFQQIGTVNANVTAAQIVNLTPQTAYTFRIRARNANGTSAPSNQVTATTPAGGGGGGDVRLPQLPFQGPHLQHHPAPRRAQGIRLHPGDALRQRRHRRPVGGVHPRRRSASQRLSLADDRPLHPVAGGGRRPADQHRDHQDLRAARRAARIRRAERLAGPHRVPAVRGPASRLGPSPLILFFVGAGLVPALAPQGRNLSSLGC
jgi:hypothetical protein